MRLTVVLALSFNIIFLTGCIKKGANPDDPYEAINRETHKFNMAFDATFLKPPALLYKKLIPATVRASINNFYDNIYMLPTIANDLLQGDLTQASNDTARFFINSTIGIGGIVDVAQRYNLPLRPNDLGLTFAKWGDKKSPYIVIPFLGPSTIRDGMGLLFEYSLFTPYPYIDDSVVLYSLIGLRYIDLRSQYLDKEQVLAEALDKYTFIRDAYLQHRNYLITGEQAATNLESGADSDYVDDEDEAGTDYVDDETLPPAESKPSAALTSN